MTNTPTGQRGAFMFVTPLLLTTIALLSVMAIDGARIYGLRNDLQNQANAAASAAAEAAQACGGADVSVATMTTRALAAAQAQGFEGSAGELQIRYGVLEQNPDDGNRLAFREMADIAASNAVHVSLNRDEPISRLLPQALLGTVRIGASAAVRKEVEAQLSAAGSTVGVSDGLLGNLLGSVFGDPSYSLDPTSLDSQENTLMNVGDLLTELGVASVADALPLGADELAAAMREIAGNATPAGALLDDMVSAAGIETVRIGDILTVAEGVQVPPDSQFRMYDLFTSLLLNVVRQQQILNGTLLSIPDLGSVLPLPPQLASGGLDVQLLVNRAPTLAYGPARKDGDGDWLTRFYAPDIGLQIDAALASELDILGLVTINLAELELPLAITTGGGTGYLTSAQCARGVANEVEFGLYLERTLLTAATGTIDPVDGSIDTYVAPVSVGTVEVLGVPVGPVVEVGLSASASVAGHHESVMVNPAYPLYCPPGSGCYEHLVADYGGGIGGLSLDDVAVTANTLGIPLPLATGIIETTLENLLGGLVESLLLNLVDPLFQALGVGVGGISVTVHGAEQDRFAQLVENVPVLN